MPQQHCLPLHNAGRPGEQRVGRKDSSARCQQTAASQSSALLRSPADEICRINQLACGLCVRQRLPTAVISRRPSWQPGRHSQLGRFERVSVRACIHAPVFSRLILLPFIGIFVLPKSGSPS